MIIDRVEDEKYLANAYLVAEGPGGSGVLIDGNGVVEPLLERVEREGITITHILLTHHHEDHVLSNDRYRERFPGVPFVGHQGTDDVLGAGSLDIILGDGGVVRSGSLEFRAIDTPGHCQGHLAYLVGDDCFTADVLFFRTLGGHARPGGNFPQLKHSTMEVLMALPHHIRVHPGHREPTTIGGEWQDNLFIRLWRGVDAEGDETVTVRDMGEGRLLVMAPDYDGGTKGLVRFPDGIEGIYFGSRITRA